MSSRPTSTSPTVLLRINDGRFHTHRSFSDFAEALRSAEAYSRAGFAVAVFSATGRLLMGFERAGRRAAV
jgi:hypothetical protein